jgi:hypothetical protein
MRIASVVQGTAAALTLCVARAAHAQTDHSGRIEGAVTDSVHARPLTGVRVVAAGVGSVSALRGDAITNATGQFRIDSLAPGRYMVGFESPLLDSLEIVLPPREVTVAPNSAATIALALPSAAKLRAAVCPKVDLTSGTGAVYGHIVNAETENPLPDVTVAIAWRERDVDRKTLRPIYRERTASDVADAAGWYVVCGVPTDTWLWMQLQHEERAGPLLRALVDDTLGIAIRHLSYSASASRPVADSAATVADSVDIAMLTGTAMVRGTVLGPGDAPVAMAEVRVRGTRGTTRTDRTGRYSLSGLPAGTQELDVRHVGFAVAEMLVELRSGTTTTRDVRLQRVVSLDSMRVTATRARYPEFTEHQKLAITGYFLGPREIEQQRVSRTADIIEKIPGFRVQQRGYKWEVLGGRGTSYSSGSCRANIIIDGVIIMSDRVDASISIDDVNPADIGAIEAYREGEPAPQGYDRGCGAIAIWTKR